MERMNVTLYTDGACSGNPGPGGYAARLEIDKAWCEIAGFDPRTTNNRMELMACIAGVKALKKPCNITVVTDSQILINCIEQLEIRSKNGWTTKTGAKVANCDLHEWLYELKHKGDHEITCSHVKGHSGNIGNERCDALARQAIATKEGYEARGRI